MTTSTWLRFTAGGAHHASGRHGHHDLSLVMAAIVAASLVVASLLLLVWVRVGQTEAGYRVHDLRTELVRLQQERATLDVERATLLRPARLAQLSRTRLGLGPVDAARVVAAPATVAP